MIGRTVSHYTILEKLGEGGMGVVYKAEDTRLKRTVALKFLPPELTRDPEANERFIQEAQAASALEHQNICNIHEIDKTDDGQLFICMACYSGQTLREKIREQSLPLDEAMNVMMQIAEGLGKAHEKGIIHRDIKPANIFITTEGQVKLVDFGIAKLIGRTKSTKTGTTVGTVAYMSPEQSQGKQVDHRTDIWSFGVVFYEILAGKQPFSAAYDQAIIYAILNLDPEPVSSFRPGTPLGLEQIIKRALAKDRTQRFASIEEVLSSMRAIRKELDAAHHEGRTVLEDSRASIAVLPFSNLSADPKQEYFCDGLAEEIINALGKLENLRVVARTSAFSFKGMAIDIREIGKKLNVTTVLEGSVRKAGKQLRISVQLINVSDGYNLWSEKFDRQMKHILTIQDEISLAIVDNLKLKILGNEKAKLLKRQTENPEAHNLYLMGRYFWNKRTKADIQKSIGLYQKAVETDASFALAYSGMAEAYVTMGIYGCMPLEDVSAKAKRAAAAALELDDTLSQAHAAMAMIKIWIDWDCAGAEREFRLALRLNPVDAEAHHQYSHLLAQLGRFEESISQMRHALKLEPLSLNINACLGQVLFLARRYDESIEQLQRTIEMNADYYDGHGWLGMAYLMKGDYGSAIATFKAAASFEIIKARMTAGLACAYAMSGEEETAQEILAGMLDDAHGGAGEPYLAATIYASLGNIDTTFEYLNKALEARSHRLFTMLKVCPLLDAIRSDQRYFDLLRQLRLE